MDAPIIPKATRNHGEDWLARKNVSEFARRDVSSDTSINTLKYKAIIPNTRSGDMGYFFCGYY